METPVIIAIAIGIVNLIAVWIVAWQTYLTRQSVKLTASTLKESQQAKEIILGLTPANYYKGMGQGERDNEEVCEFGVCLGEEDIYIKLLINRQQEKAFCFSFHIADRDINYPFADDVG